MARILALDFGTKRTGVAVTDELKMIASGLTTVETPQLISFLEDYFLKENVELVLVGEPKQRDGAASQSEEFIQEFLKTQQTKVIFKKHLCLRNGYEIVTFPVTFR